MGIAPSNAGILFFDLDGPLLDVSARYVTLHQKVLSELGQPSLPGPAYWQRKRARCPEESILAEIGMAAHAESYVRRRLALIETPEYLAHDCPWPWVHDTLARLGASHRLVLVTARANRPRLVEQLDRLGLVAYFHEVLSTPAGPHVDQQKAVLIRDHLARHECTPGMDWMVGDTEADVGAGRLTGLRTVAVLSGIRNREWLLRAEPDYLFNDIRELISQCGLGERAEGQADGAALVGYKKRGNRHE
jgi:phosphoglycolate phosphatase-like HAD superfamily hydrolase